MITEFIASFDKFSEDIDLVVLRHEGETDNKLKSKLKAIGKLIKDELPEVEIEGITYKRGMIRKTVHTYNQLFEGNYGQVRDVIVLLIFNNTENVWNELRNIYTGDFRNLVYGELPEEQAILETLKKIQTRLADINWTVETDNFTLYNPSPS